MGLGHVWLQMNLVLLALDANARAWCKCRASRIFLGITMRPALSISTMAFTMAFTMRNGIYTTCDANVTDGMPLCFLSHIDVIGPILC